MNQLSLQGIKLITFDVTGTLLKFKKPPYKVYTEFAKAAGLIVDEDEVKVNFKKHFQQMSQEKPHFGECWETWWTTVVTNTFKVS